jgi:succinate dehydrogenase / fumarate reductase cytochrome b subunit
VVDISAKSKCCGFPLLMHNETNALNMTGDHTGEARSKGADGMVTPCPLCHLELDGQQGRAEKLQQKEINMPVLHLPQLIGLAFGYTPKELDMNRHIVPTRAIEGKLAVQA